MTQPVLPLQTRGVRCGYCERPLTLQPAGDWACAHCKPLLAKVRDVEDYKRFCAEAARGLRRTQRRERR